MNYVLSVIDRAKEFLPTHTDYALSKALGVSQSELIAIKKGRGFFGPKARMRLHEITGIPLEELTAMLEMQRAKTQEDKAFWSQRLPRITAASIVAALCVAAIALEKTGIAAHAFAVSPAIINIHYAK